MPILNERTTKKVELEALKGAEVIMYSTLVAGDMEKIAALTEEEQKRRILYPLTFMIRSWNITDADGAELAITEENIGKLDMRDVKLLFKAVDLPKEDFFTHPAGNGGTK